MEEGEPALPGRSTRTTVATKRTQQEYPKGMIERSEIIKRHRATLRPTTSASEEEAAILKGHRATLRPTTSASEEEA